MRAKCTSKASFKLQLWLWKQRESVAGRTHKFTASAALKILQRLNGTPPSQPGLQLIHVASSGKVTTVNQTAPPPSGSKHTRTRESREEVEASKHGVEVSHFIFDDIVANRSTALVRGVVTNHDPTPCVLRSVHLFAVASYPPLILPVALGSGGSWRPSVSCRPTADGVCHGLLWFTFNTGGISFRIGRLLEARCGDELILDMLKPTAPYVRAKAKGAPLSAHEVHQAVKAPLKEATGDAPRHKLKEYALEKFLFRDVLRAGGPDVFEVLERGNKLLCFMRDGARLGLVPNDAAAMAEYTAHQQRLLVTEEVQLIHDLHMFDMVGENATVLTRRANLLWLRVEGLAEKRPSVLLGDKVLIRLADGSAIKQRLRYEGVAERIEMNDVGLKIKNDFVNSYLPGQRVEVQGCFSWLPWTAAHMHMDPYTRHAALDRWLCTLAFTAPQLPAQAETPAQMILRVSHSRLPAVRGAAAFAAAPLAALSLSSLPILSSSPAGQLPAQPLRRFHQGAELSSLLPPSILFPEPRDLAADYANNLAPRVCGLFFNDTLDEAQKLAVRAVGGGRTRRVPYVIFGPPGTCQSTLSELPRAVLFGLSIPSPPSLPEPSIQDLLPFLSIRVHPDRSGSTCGAA
jgi:hypothetical protein